ncbi:MAG TPA: S8 family serine peptidase [Gemmatimonadaceae bacterium]
MIRRTKWVSALAIAAGATAAACADNTITQPAARSGAQLSVAGEGAAAKQYVIVGSLPSNLEAKVAAFGGKLTASYPQIGVAIAEGDDAFAANAAGLKGIETVVQDVVFEQAQPKVVDLDESAFAVASEGVTESTIADTYANPYYFAEWGPRAIGAPAAWAAGYRGAGARVAILDGGLYTNHQDLAGAIDIARSRSFVPNKAFDSDVGTLWHGTHVAGIVGARDNKLGVVGIAPEATLIGVKVLHNGGGTFGWAINGIMYASTPIAQGGAGAQIINMSLGALVDKGQPGYSDAGLRSLIRAIDRATAYAWDNGVTVIAAAGNDTTNLDNRAFINLPSQTNKVISVAATGPMGWAYGATDYSRQASYTNSGKAGVDLAAPGGDFAYPTNELCTVFNPSRTGGLRTACWVFDMYLSTSRGSSAAGSYSWAAGTSMASPATAGVAALIVGKYSGMITPAAVRAKLQQSAEDLGKPGNDEVYGMGWINAGRAVQQ